MATRGPQAGPIIFRYTGIDRLIKTLGNLIDKLDEPEMAPVVRGVAKVWRDNYDKEGAAVGGWKPLSEYTRNIRQWRGYNPEHPILRQSGGLRRAAVTYPAEFKSRSMSRSTPPTPQSDGTQTTININTTRNKAELILTGSKVANQGRASNTGSGWGGTQHEHRSVGRKFWFIDDRAREAATQAVMDTIKKDLDSLG